VLEVALESCARDEVVVGSMDIDNPEVVVGEVAEVVVVGGVVVVVVVVVGGAGAADVVYEYDSRTT
jgi:hypothetical protein